MIIKYKKGVHQLVVIGIFTALLIVLSQLSIPLPSGVPITLQTFAVALCGYVLGAKLGAISIFAYIVLGAIGMPVYANFTGGFGILFGASGGFFWGFILIAILCGLSIKSQNKAFSIVVGCLSIVFCHICGVIQFMGVTHQGFLSSFLVASAPYLIKDFISVSLAYFASLSIKNALVKIN